MSEKIGVTFVVPDGVDPVPVYDADGGAEVFETDDPYLMSDGRSLMAPLPVVLTAGSTWEDAAGVLVDAIAVSGLAADSDIAIGALTLTGAGGAVVAVADGTYGPYTVAGGVMTPNTSPVTPGTYDVGGLTVQVEADVYDVATGELAAVIALGSAALDGKTIKLRPGADACGAAVGSSVTFGTALALPTGLTITSRDASAKGYLRRMLTRQNGIINLRDLVIRDFWKPGDYPWSALIDRDTNGGGTANTDDLRIERCEIYADVVTPADLVPDAVSTITTGHYFKIASVSSSDWTVFGGPASAEVGDNFMATASGSIAALGTAYPFPQTLRLMGNSGLGPNQTRALRVWDSRLHDGEYGLAGSYRSLSIQRSLFDGFYGDMMQFAVTGEETLWEVRDNALQASVGASGGPFDVHVDVLQANLIGMVQANTVPYTVVGNRLWPADASMGGQGLFFENFNASRFPVTVDIRHNMLLTSQANGITLETGSDDSVIRWNTVAFNVDNPGGAGLVPKIGVWQEEGGVLVRDNIHSGLAFGTVPLTTAKLENNHQFASFDNAGMDDVLTGTDFSASGFADLATFTAAMMPRAGSAVDASYGPKIGAGWYYSWGAAPAGSVSGLGEGTASEPAAVAPAPFTGGQWDVAPGNALIEVTVSALPNNGGAAIADIEYRVDGGSPVSSGGAVTFVITGLANGTEYDVEIRAVNAVGAGAWSGVKSVSPTNAYTINAVAVPSAALLSENPFNAAAMSAFTIDFWVRFPGTYPTSGTLLTFQNAAGSSQITINQASSGRLSFFSGGLATAYTLPSSTLAADTWHHIQWSVDTRAGQRRAQLYVNGVSRPITSAVADDTLTQAIGRVRVSDLSANIELADVYALLGDSIDFSDADERAKFAATASKGADGSVPTGAAPDLFLSGATGSWHTNKGTGGGLTLSGGSLTTAGSVPV